MNVYPNEWTVRSLSVKLFSQNGMERRSLSSLHCFVRMAFRTPSKAKVATIADRNDRFELLASILPRVPLGTRLLCDVKKVGPANPNTFKLPMSAWKERLKIESGKRCRGTFCAAFNRKQLTRQCELVASTGEVTCTTCSLITKQTENPDAQEISLEATEAYVMTKIAVFSRKAIKDCMGLWYDEAKKRKAEFKTSKQYPFYSAHEAIEMLLCDSLVIHRDGGRGGKSYARSDCMIQAQNEYVQICIPFLLDILAFEKKQEFKLRWKQLTSAATCIHEQMQHQNANGEMPQVGAIQASDVVREELARAAQVAKLKRAPARHLSLPVQRLLDWARDKRMKRPKRKESLESVDTPNPDATESQHTDVTSAVAPALDMVPVPPPTSGPSTLEELMKEFSFPAPKKTLVQQSTVPEAGLGLFLLESSKDNEMVARYSGTVLSAKQAAQSKSEYKLQVNKDLCIDAKQKGHLEARYIKDARKAGKEPNVRFGASLKARYCKKTGVAWVPVFAIGDIVAPVEMWADYGSEFWEAGEGKVGSRQSQSQEPIPGDEEGDIDRESDEDFVPPPSAASGMENSQNGPMTRSRTSHAHAQHAKATESSLTDSTGGTRDADTTPVEAEQMHSNSGLSDKRVVGTTNGKAQTEPSVQTSTAKQLQFSSPSESDSSKQADEQSWSTTSHKKNRKPSQVIYAVAVGRCVGMFQSSNRMQASISGYPKSQCKRCKSEGAARAYLASFCIHDPVVYWKRQQQRDTTIQTHPRKWLQRQVFFPVGLPDSFYEAGGHGRVIDLSIENGKCTWSVKMDNGFIDPHVPEWPLTCGLEKADHILGPRARIRQRVFHAIRGTKEAGVYHSLHEVPALIRHDGQKYQQFESEKEAREWIRQWASSPSKETVFYAVRGRISGSVETDFSKAVKHMDAHSEMREFHAEVDAWHWATQTQKQNTPPRKASDKKSNQESDNMFFAVRGPNCEGVYADATEAIKSFDNQSELESFKSITEARKWIAEKRQRFFALRGTARNGVFTSSVAHTADAKSEFAELREFSTYQEADRWVKAGECFVVYTRDGSVQAVQVGESGQARKHFPEATFKGPFVAPIAHGIANALNKKPETNSSSCNVAGKSNSRISASDPITSCIARLGDGSTCGRTSNVTLSNIGPLCGWHAQVIPRTKPTDMSQSKEVNGTTEPKTIPQTVKTTVKDSPSDTILLPSGKETLRMEKAGQCAVIAVRTFPDSAKPKKPAGSVWLSLQDAEQANSKAGEVRVFNTHGKSNGDGIFANIAEAQAWIEQQIQEEASTDEENCQQTFDNRLRDSRSRIQSSSSSVKNRGGRGRGKRSRRGKGRGNRGGSKRNRKKSSKARSTSRPPSDPSDWEHTEDSGDQSSNSSQDGSDDSESQCCVKGSCRRRQFQRVCMGLEDRGGLRSGSARLLDERQKNIEDSLFPEGAQDISFHFHSVPHAGLLSRIPNPGQAQAMSRSRKGKHVPKITFDDKTQAVLAEKRFKAFPAFSLSDLMQFQQQVEHVAELQSDEEREAALTVVDAMRLIARIAIRVHQAMRDSGDFGPNGENFRAFTYLHVQFLVMYREVYAGANAEQYFWNKAKQFAVKARGSPGMSPWIGTAGASSNLKSVNKGHERCLVCGKPGHRATAEIHQEQMAEGAAAYSVSQMQQALDVVGQDNSLTADKKKSWSGRIKAFWAALKAGGGNADVP